MIRTILACLTLSVTMSLQAELISFKFTGTVTDADVAAAGFDGSVTNGTPFTGFYTFESTTPDGDGDPTVGDYWYTNAAYGVAVKVGNYVFRTNPDQVDFVIEVVNRGNDDTYLFRSYLNVASSGASMDDIEFQMYDESGTAWTNDALPIVPPILSAFPDGHHLGIHGANFGIYGPVESITVNSTVVTNPPAATIHSAVEVTWPSQFGYFYQVQESTNLVDWTNRGAPILGTGNPISIFVRQKPENHYFRLIITTHGG